MNTLKVYHLFCFFSLLISCTEQTQISSENSETKAIIKALHQEYVEGWKTMDEERIMNLVEDNAMLQPNRFTPVIGKDKIRDFWFPKDSSQTIINEFNTNVLDVHVLDSIAIATHESYLDWTYKKDTVEFGMIQKGINTTIYRKQKDDSWKIWRSMWTDLSALSK